MKVLWITANFRPLLGGLEVYTDRAVGSLAALCEVRLVTQHGQGPASEKSVGHATVPLLGIPSNEAEWLAVRTMVAERIAEFGPDVVHFANAGVAVYRDVVPAGVVTVATVHGNDLTAPWQWVPGRDVSQLIVEALSKCDGVFAVSSHTAALVREFGVRGEVTVIPAGCDTSYFQPQAGGGGSGSKLPMVLTVGRLVARKGHECILKALRLLPVDVHWTIVGDGPMHDALAKTIREAGLAARVTLAGSVSDKKLLELYQTCSMFVLMPEERRHRNFIDSEGFGLVFQEAGACAKPVIGSDISGCRDAVIDGSTGLLVPPGDFEALAAAMLRVLEEPGLAQRLGNNARSFLLACGGWNRFTAQTFEQYEALTARDKVTFLR